VEAGGKKVGGFKKFQKLSARTKMSKNIQILFQTIQTIIQKIPENGSKKYPENSDKSVLNYRHLFLRDIPSQKVQNFGRWV